MTITRQLEIAEAILATGLVTQVFHSVQLTPINDEPSPTYPVGAEYSFAGIDDSKGLFAYIRTAGDYTSEQVKLEGCGHSYKISAPLRIVFFNDNEDRNQDDLLRRLGSFTFNSGVFLNRVITDKNRLVRDESPMFRTAFDAKTFYVAFDVTVTFLLLRSTCDSGPCIVHPNPLKLCPAAAPQYSESAT